MSDLQQPTASSPTMVADAIPSAVASATATVPHLKPSHSTDTLMAGGVAGIQLNLQQSSPMPHVHDHGHAHMAIDKTVTAVADNAMDTDLIRPEAPNTQPQSAWAAATSGQSPSNAIISPTARMSITATTTIAHPATDRKRARVQSIVAVQGAGTHVLDLDMGKIAPSVACEWNVVSALAESPPQLSVPLSPVTTSQHIDGEVTDAAAQSEAHANKLRRVKTRSRDNSFSSSTSGRRSVDERRTSASGNMQSPTPPPPVATPLRITIKSTGEFQDQFGRTIWMRGVNLCAKLPQGQSASDKPPASESFFDDRNVSFVGQPFPLAEADEHFTRLRVWGLTLVRLGVTWEALEHAGPGKYDEAYVEYLIKFVEKAGHHGFRVIIDPHQDVWSRFSGGSGAPGWTFDVAGLDIRSFGETGAAHIHRWDVPKETQVMLWPTNYTKLAAATMFTLFFGGNTFAPNTEYQGQRVQDYLQERYIACFTHLARRLRHLKNIIGFESMNEPHYGFIGLHSMNAWSYDECLHLGQNPSALQSFALGDGVPQKVDYYTRSWPYPTRKTGTVLVNGECKSAWRGGCIWRKHGVWDMQMSPLGAETSSSSSSSSSASDPGKHRPVALKPDYFTKHPLTGEPIDFDRDFYLPFIKRYATAIRAVYAEDEASRATPIFILAGPIPNEDPPRIQTQEDADALGVGANFVYAPHWYDLPMLFSKSFNKMVGHNTQALARGSRNIFRHTYFGKSGIRKNYLKQISSINCTGRAYLGGNMSVPPVIYGECGIPMDINDHAGFHTLDYSRHTQAMDGALRAMELSHATGFTIWNYNPRNSVRFGDSWNGEDFSIYSPDVFQQTASALSNHHLNLRSRPASVSAAKHEHYMRSVLGKLKLTPAMAHRFGSWYVGGRVLDAVIRPYAAKLAGRLESSRFEYKRKWFSLRFWTDPEQLHARDSASLVTEIFLPDYHFHVPSGSNFREYLDVHVSDGTVEYYAASQTLLYRHDPKSSHHVVNVHARQRMTRSTSTAESAKVEKEVGS